jgi:hypothetical protein
MFYSPAHRRIQTLIAGLCDAAQAALIDFYDGKWPLGAQVRALVSAGRIKRGSILAIRCAIWFQAAPNVALGMAVGHPRLRVTAFQIDEGAVVKVVTA